jgi:hypothetical protein
MNLLASSRYAKTCEIKDLAPVDPEAQAGTRRPCRDSVIGPEVPRAGSHRLLPEQRAFAATDTHQTVR